MPPHQWCECNICATRWYNDTGVCEHCGATNWKIIDNVFACKNPEQEWIESLDDDLNSAA